MTNNRRSNAAKVAGKLFSHEDAIDAAITSNGELVAAMLSARQDSNLSAVFGHDALEEVVECGYALLRARARIVSGHKALADAQSQLGLAPMSFGGFQDKQKDSGTPLAAVRLAA